MGLRETFQSGAASVISAFGNVAVTGLAYHSLGTYSYNATTGMQTESGAVNTTITYIPDEIQSKEIQDRNIKITDRKLLVANTDISVTPKVGDYVTIDGVKYNVVDWLTDPAEALYEIFVRRT